MKNILLTGSETFGKYLANPSKWLALTVDGKEIAGYKIHSLILPSVVLVPEGDEDPGIRIVKHALKINAKAIISFGMSSNVPGFRIESSATNWIYNEKYCNENENKQPLDNSRPSKERLNVDMSNWDFEKMKQLFKSELLSFDPKVSTDIGNYSCNNWMYRSLLAMQKMQVNIPFLFVHTYYRN